MKQKLLILYIFLFLQNIRGQHYSVFREMSSQPSLALALAESGGDFNRHTSSYPFAYLMHEINIYDKVYEIWDGKSWIELKKIVVKGGTIDLNMWGDRIICSGRIESYDGIKAPLGKYFGFLEYKNGQWDTLSGCMFDSAFSFGNVCATIENLYMVTVEKGIPYVEGRNVYKYDINTRKFIKEVSIEGNWGANIQILAGKHRLLMTDIYKANNDKTIGFACLDDNKGLNSNSDSAFSNYLFYGIDGTNDHIHAIQPDNLTILEYSDKLLQTRKVKTIPISINRPSSSYKFIQVWKGNILWNWYDYVSTTSFNILCPGDSVWTSMEQNNINGTVWSGPIVSKYGVFMRDYKKHVMLELSTGQGARIYGSTYIDLDSNCNFNSTKEKFLHEFPVSIKSDNNSSTAYTLNNGQYEFFADKGSYRISVEGAFSKCVNSSINISKNDTSIIKDLPVKGPYKYDYKAGLYGAKRLRWNSDIVLDAYVKNDGFPDDSAYIELKSDDRITIKSCSIPGITIKGNEAKGKIYGLGYLESRNIRFFGVMDTSVIKPDSAIDISFRSYISHPEKDSSDNHENSHLEVVYSFDPNHKDCNRHNIVPGKSAKLEYFIGFQNEGKDDALDVVIIDTLSSSLVPETISILGFSHPASISISGNILKISFKNIFLKPRSEDENGSQGFINFSISTVGTLNDGDSVSNTAYIYFDLNQAVVTEPSVVRVTNDQNNSIHSVISSNSIRIYPNPSRGIFNIILNEEPAAIYELEVYDPTGKPVYKKTDLTSQSGRQIDLSSYSGGVYLAKVSIKGVTYFIKLFIE